ncbi:MAG: hypothetical protein IPM02_21535 [Betaproteobacteria bacterium]|nr:hypothetical protein [Betaproteobacteria bacterium]
MLARTALARCVHVVRVALVFMARIGLPRMRQDDLRTVSGAEGALAHQAAPGFLLIGEVAVALLLLGGAPRWASACRRRWTAAISLARIPASLACATAVPSREKPRV